MLTVQNLGHTLRDSFQCKYRRTYSTLASGVKGRTRLQQVVDWVGGKHFEGALVFDECGLQRGWGEYVAWACTGVPRRRIIFRQCD